MARPVRLFISYAREDEDHRIELEKRLKQLQRDGLVETWHDRKLLGGDEWKQQIDQQLQEADVILLLISPDFLHSDYCYDIEMKRAVERHDQGTARVIPIILRLSEWHSAPFGKLQALPKDSKAVATWQDRDEAWLDVAKGIKQLLGKQLIRRTAQAAEFPSGHQRYLLDGELPHHMRTKPSHLLPCDVNFYPDGRMSIEGEHEEVLKVAKELSALKQENERLRAENTRLQDDLKKAQQPVALRPFIENGSILASDRSTLGGSGNIVWGFTVTNEDGDMFELVSAKCEWLLSDRIISWLRTNQPSAPLPDRRTSAHIQDIPLGGRYVLRRGDRQKRGASALATDIQPHLQRLGIPANLLGYWPVAIEPRITVTVEGVDGNQKTITKTLQRDHRGPNEPF